MIRTPIRIFLAIAVGAFGAWMVSVHVFVAIDRVRVKALPEPVQAVEGAVRVTLSRLKGMTTLRPPLALIARVQREGADQAAVSITIDDVPVCERVVPTGRPRRLDCAVTRWGDSRDHVVTIRGPAPWTLQSLELATHHGNTTGVHYLVVLPAASNRYSRPGLGWAIATWAVLAAAIVVLPGPSGWRPGLRMLYGAGVVLVATELSAGAVSPLVSDYRVVFSAGTFTLLIALVLAPPAGVAIHQLRARLGLVVRRRVDQTLLVLLVLGAAAAVWDAVLRDRARARLFAELQPVALANCEFRRFGEPNDGGYVQCANLLGAVESAYSYGISGYDQWGCDISMTRSVPVHQYDCFDLERPLCPGGRTVFHEECIGGETATIEGRLFDTLERQIHANGDRGKRLVVKMDVEGAEWESLLRAPDDVLRSIDQLSIELHGTDQPQRFLDVVLKLKRLFYVANLHFNNYACAEAAGPFPAGVYEVLLVNKAIAVPGGAGPAGARPALQAPNKAESEDCQGRGRL
jgi:hypothetical protein